MHDLGTQIRPIYLIKENEPNEQDKILYDKLKLIITKKYNVKETESTIQLEALNTTDKMQIYNAVNAYNQVKVDVYTENIIFKKDDLTSRFNIKGIYKHDDDIIIYSTNAIDEGLICCLGKETLFLIYDYRYKLLNRLITVFQDISTKNIANRQSFIIKRITLYSKIILFSIYLLITEVLSVAFIVSAINQDYNDLQSIKILLNTFILIVVLDALILVLMLINHIYESRNKQFKKRNKNNIEKLPNSLKNQNNRKDIYISVSLLCIFALICNLIIISIFNNNLQCILSVAVISASVILIILAYIIYLCLNKKRLQRSDITNHTKISIFIVVTTLTLITVLAYDSYNFINNIIQKSKMVFFCLIIGFLPIILTLIGCLIFTIDAISNYECQYKLANDPEIEMFKLLTTESEYKNIKYTIFRFVYDNVIHQTLDTTHGKRQRYKYVILVDGVDDIIVKFNIINRNGKTFFRVNTKYEDNKLFKTKGLKNIFNTSHSSVYKHYEIECEFYDSLGRNNIIFHHDYDDNNVPSKTALLLFHSETECILFTDIIADRTQLKEVLSKFIPDTAYIIRNKTVNEEVQSSIPNKNFQNLQCMSVNTTLAKVVQ